MADRPSDRAIAQALRWAREELDRRGPGETIALAAAVALIWHKAREFDASASPPEPISKSQSKRLAIPRIAEHASFLFASSASFQRGGSVEPTTNPPEIGSKSVVEPTAEQMSEWQPIETAPTKGRTMILLLTPSRLPQVAWSNTWWTAGSSVECKPTHWLAIPELPMPPNAALSGCEREKQQ